MYMYVGYLYLSYAIYIMCNYVCVSTAQPPTLTQMCKRNILKVFGCTNVYKKIDLLQEELPRDLIDFLKGI